MARVSRPGAHVSLIHDTAITQKHVIFAFGLEAGGLHWCRDRTLPAHIGIIPREGDATAETVTASSTASMRPSGTPAPTRRCAQAYHPSNIFERVANKRALEQRFGLEPGEGPIFSAVSRPDRAEGPRHAAGPDIDSLVAHGGRLIVLGSGEAQIENGLAGAALGTPARSGVVIGYRRNAQPPDPGRRRRHPDSVALRALRADPARRPALWLHPGGEPGGRRSPIR